MAKCWELRASNSESQLINPRLMAQAVRCGTGAEMIGWQSHIFGIVIILMFSCPCIQKVTSPMVQGSFCGWEAQLVQAHQTFFMPGTRSESARTPQCPELGWIISVLIFGSEPRSDRSSCKNNYPPHRAPSYELVYNILKHFTTPFSTCIYLSIIQQFLELSIIPRSQQQSSQRKSREFAAFP